MARRPRRSFLSPFVDRHAAAICGDWCCAEHRTATRSDTEEPRRCLTTTRQTDSRKTKNQTAAKTKSTDSGKGETSREAGREEGREKEGTAETGKEILWNQYIHNRL